MKNHWSTFAQTANSPAMTAGNAHDPARFGIRTRAHMRPARSRTDGICGWRASRGAAARTRVRHLAMTTADPSPALKSWYRPKSYSHSWLTQVRPAVAKLYGSVPNEYSP